MLRALSKIVLIGSFCTSASELKCSHRLTMLRFHRLASHKNSSIIDDFKNGTDAKPSAEIACKLCRGAKEEKPAKQD